MNQALLSWLQGKTPPAGVLAWGIRVPQSTGYSRCFDPGYTEDAVENAWRCVADTLQVARMHRFPNRRLRWTFEHGWLFCAVRPEGGFLGIFTVPQADQIDWMGLEALFAEYQSPAFTEV